MKTIGFIGAYDKINLVLYIAKILTTLNKTVLVIDATLNQKARYIVPAIMPTKSYITEFESIDVAVGLYNYDSIRRYTGISNTQPLEYDYVLIDVDNTEAIENFEIEKSDKNYFVTGFDEFSLKKGIELINSVRTPTQLIKVLFSKEMVKEEDEYLDYLALGSKTIWSEYKIMFPLEIDDQMVIMQNQRVFKIKLKKLSAQYKESLVYLIQEMIKDIPENEIRKAVKSIEREG